MLLMQSINRYRFLCKFYVSLKSTSKAENFGIYSVAHFLFLLWKTSKLQQAFKNDKAAASASLDKIIIVRSLLSRRLWTPECAFQFLTFTEPFITQLILMIAKMLKGNFNSLLSSESSGVRSFLFVCIVTEL